MIDSETRSAFEEERYKYFLDSLKVREELKNDTDFTVEQVTVQHKVDNDNNYQQYIIDVSPTDKIVLTYYNKDDMKFFSAEDIFRGHTRYYLDSNDQIHNFYYYSNLSIENKVLKQMLIEQERKYINDTCC